MLAVLPPWYLAGSRCPVADPHPPRPPRSAPCRDGKFSVMDAQHQVQPEDLLGDLARQLQYSFPPFLPEGASLYDPQQQQPSEEQEMSTRLDKALRAESLDAIKSRLENLLPEN